MVPVQSPQDELFLRRGHDEDPQVRRRLSYLLKARAVLLEPQHAFLVADRVISRAGVLADRYFRRTRSPTAVRSCGWLASRDRDDGPGWSGLRFDVVRPMAQSTST